MPSKIKLQKGNKIFLVSEPTNNLFYLFNCGHRVHLLGPRAINIFTDNYFFLFLIPDQLKTGTLYREAKFRYARNTVTGIWENDMGRLFLKQLTLLCYRGVIPYGCVQGQYFRRRLGQTPHEANFRPPCAVPVRDLGRSTGARAASRRTVWRRRWKKGRPTQTTCSTAACLWSVVPTPPLPPAPVGWAPPMLQDIWRACFPARRLGESITLGRLGELTYRALSPDVASGHATIIFIRKWVNLFMNNACVRISPQRLR